VLYRQVTNYDVFVEEIRKDVSSLDDKHYSAFALDGKVRSKLV
jgi:hypothetical protein